MIFLFIILLFVSPLFVLVPIPAMAGVIILVAWKLVNLRAIRHILGSPPAETAIAGIAFLVALFVELEFEALYPAQKNTIFVIRGVGQLDLPAAELLIDEAKRRRARGGELCIKTKIARTIEQLDRYSVPECLGAKKVHLSKGDAIASLVPRLDDSICAKFHVGIFTECNDHSVPKTGSLEK